ncbi:MAG: hypothetical protein OXI11_08225 [Gammaproteobacteria bacterium]|nr:hypothetical protein [Gammaproteobacteria bacterium]MDE2655255.1 hypothetical protein [Gemmatimonadota bacterium]MXW45227.1 hypothetical protein [Gammaproteobacteria bacterium]MYD01143.1 hypothetical protein [Gammaproteobacteria bacterium]MYI24891.1 hypothetical protein [Gammaproteobacteria bacterium]
MTKAIESHANKTVLGAGEVYIDVLDAAGKRTGERYVGDSTGASVSATTERTTIFSGDGAVARTLLDKITSVNHTMSVTIQDMQPENFALFLAGEVEEVADGSTSANEAIEVKAGLWYQLGVKNTAAGRAGAAKEIKAAVRYIEDDATGLGNGSNWYIRQATVGPAGELALKDRSTPQAIGLQILVEVPAIAGEEGHPAILVDGAPYGS